MPNPKRGNDAPELLPWICRGCGQKSESGMYCSKCGAGRYFRRSRLGPLIQAIFGLVLASAGPCADVAFAQMSPSDIRGQGGAICGGMVFYAVAGIWILWRSWKEWRG